MSSNALIELRGVSKRYGRQEVVTNLDLQVRGGEFLTLLGESGSGKTTTLRMIGGFEYPTRGEVFLDGECVNHRPPYLRNVNTVFQNYALFPHMTVFDNIAFGLRMKRLPREETGRRVADALRMVKLEGKESRLPRELSGGQQQRVSLARALVNRPMALLLDEPLGALDLKLRRAMQRELKELQRQLGITFLYVTHDQEEALTMSDRIGILARGRLIQLGAPEEIYHRPRSHFVADFVGETNFLRGEIVRVTDSRAAVRVGNLEFRSSLAETLRDGSPVELLIRPEAIRLSAELPSSSESFNSVRVRVAELLFAGPAIRYRLRGDGLEDDLIVTSAERLPLGGTWWATWDVASTIALPVEEN